jgi:predicted  nucleic acid-binding Zn-ribbon protein
MIERAQAGLPIDSDDAIKEYIEAGVAAGILGGPIGAVGGAAQRDVAPQELDQDIKELAAEGAVRFQFAAETEREIEAERAKALAAAGIDPDAPLGLDAPEVPLALPAPESVDIAPETTIADDEFANLSFDKAQYERVLQQVKADITSGKPINIPAIQQRVKTDIPGTKVSQVRDVMNELKARGFVAENPASKKNKFIAMGAISPEVRTPDVSYRRQIDSATDFIKADQQRLERLQYDLRSAEAYGRDLEGNRATPNQVNDTIARVEQRISQNQQRIQAANQRLQTLGQDTHVPRFEKVGLPPQMKAVPVAEGTVEALRPRFEAQQNSIRGMKEQLNSVNKQVRKINDQAKKRTLSSNELDRMQKLQQQQAEVSTRLGEAQANLKTPEKIFQEAKGEQFREQERQREIERKLAAARARAAADQVKAQEDQGVSPITPAFNEKQDRVFAALQKRLNNLGLKDVKL